MSSRVIFVVGTRPEAIKIEPVAAALAARGLMPTLIFTGQHPSLRPVDYGLDLYPGIRLDCPGKEDPHTHVGLASSALAPLLGAEAPELVVVQGDTSSALAGALAAGMAGISVAHVEAGLRTHDLRQPWPEEEFRLAIDRDAELLFAPTELSAANLRRERVRGQIHVTGNSGIDAVLALRNRIAIGDRSIEPRLLVTCHRRENWGGGLRGIAMALRQIAEEGMAEIEVILHPNPILSGSMREMLRGQADISFRQACSHLDTLEAMVGSALVLSDSGGMQEEAAALGVPLLILRDRTERPEGIASGHLELVGTDPRRIVAAVRRRLGSPEVPAALPFGDGRAGERIAAIVAHWLGADEVAEMPRYFPERRSRANA